MLKKVPELSEYDRGNGVCRYLAKNNLCMIYSNRPIICNVEKMYDLYFKNIMIQEDYILGNLNACIELASNAKNRYLSILPLTEPLKKRFTNRNRYDTMTICGLGT
jgi:Fe-S-cluster containining protein